MSIEQELPDLLEELADSHIVEAPPAVEALHAVTDSPVRRRARLLTLAAVAAGSVVLIAGLVAIGSRDSSPSPADSPEPQPIRTDSPQPSSALQTTAPTSAPGAEAPVGGVFDFDLVRIDARSTEAGTTGVVLVFDDDVPSASLQFVEDPTEPRSDGVGYTTQHADGQSISVCGDAHSFPPPGNQTVDVFLPSDWFDPAAALNPPIEWDPDGTAPAKIIVCEPRANSVQVSIWGSASGRLDDIDIRIDGPEIVIEITPDPTTAETEARTSTPSTGPAQVLCVLDDAALTPGDGERVVRIALECGDGAFPFDLELVERVVPDADDPLEAAVAQLLSGATPEEIDAGYSSAFSSETDGHLRSIRIDANGIAIIDLTRDFVQTNNFSTSNLSRLVLSQIEATVFERPDVDGLDLQVEGERWCGWEITCDDVAFPLTLRPANPAAALDFNLNSDPPRGPSVFGYSALTAVNDFELLDEVSEALGQPDVDTGWVPIPDTYACTGASEYRSLLWDDARFVLERSANPKATILAGWSIGDTALAF